MSPAGVFEHLKHIYWNVHWQGRYQPTDFANIANPWNITLTGGALGNMANVSHAIDGAPNDPKFSGAITAAGTANCNATARAAFASPNVRESAVWSEFDVRR
jgi:hypothetical protein